MIVFLLVLVVALTVTYALTPKLMTKLFEAGITGRDMNKPAKPKLPEMGGVTVVSGFVAGLLVAIALVSFEVITAPLSMEYILAALSTVLIMALIGVIDDLIVVKQHIKASLPLLAALPLMAVKAGTTTMAIPFLGPVDVGILYVLVLIPLGITGASNAMNMLAGFNGLEAGLGIVMCATIAIVSYMTGSTMALIISLSMLGALIGFIRYNWHPARILPGDVGTLSIGAVVASSVIIGNLEKVGIILIIPFTLELYLKLRSKFKAESWCEIKGEKLVCPNKRQIYSTGRLIMYLSGGIKEEKLVLTIIGLETIFGIIAILSFL